MVCGLVGGGLEYLVLGYGSVWLKFEVPMVDQFRAAVVRSDLDLIVIFS